MADSTVTTNPFFQAILNGPAGPPPPGVRPNFVDPSNIGASVVGLATAFAVITMIMLVIRIFTKLHLIRVWNMEDYLIILAWALQLYMTVQSFFLFQSGMGIDMWNLRLSRFLLGLHYIDNLGITYVPTVTLIKVAILVQLLRIFVPQRKANMTLWLTIISTTVTVVLFYTIILGFAIWKCNPREKAWNPLLPGSCYDTNLLYQVTGIFNIISDFAVFIIPIWPVWKLQLHRSKKLAIIALFATGLFDCIAAIMRTYETWVLIDSTNISRNIAVTGCWLAAEIGLGIMVCCFPVMPRFLQYLRSYFRTEANMTQTSWVTKPSKNEHSIPTTLGTTSRDEEIKIESSFMVEYT